MEAEGSKEADSLFNGFNPLYERCEGKYKTVLNMHLQRVRNMYQEALQFLEQAKNYEREEKEGSAIDAYFQAGKLVEELKSWWEGAIENKRFNLEMELSAINELSKTLSPSSSDITNLFSQINNGLNGRMKELYESPEKRELWQEKDRRRRNESFQRGYYLLQRDLNPDKTAQVIDKLKGIDWLVLEYQEIFSLSQEHREKLSELFTAQKLTLEKQVTTYLTQSLNLPQEIILSHDIEVSIRPYNYISDIQGMSLDEIEDKKSVSIKLNFSGKTGSDIVNFGFNSAKGYDPNIVYITPQTLLNIERVEEGHHLEIYNPQYKSSLGLGIINEPALAQRAAERAEEILDKLSH